MAHGISANDDFAKIGKELYQTIEEHEKPIALKVDGFIPAWLEGSLLRLGPGKFEWGKSTYNHWFDGQAIVHKFVIKDGQVKYCSKFLHSNSYDKSKKYGRVTVPGFATWAPPDPCKNIFQRFALYFLPPAMTDNCNINVVTLKDEAYASTETPYLLHVDPQSLDTLDECDLRTALSGPRSMLVHTHQDDEGNIYNISTDWFKFKYEVFKVPPREDASNPFSGLEIVGSIPFSFTGPAYFHSFGMSENYFIVIENPFLMSKFWKVFVMNFMKWSYLDVLKWKPEHLSRIHLVDRKTGLLVKTFLAKNFFAFHHVNAYETETDVVVDVCGYPDASVVEAFYLRKLRSGLKDVTYTMPALRRYKLPKSELYASEMLKTAASEGEIGYEMLLEGFELPRINYAFNTKKYTFAYGTVFRDKNFFLEKIAKINVDTKEVINWQEEHSYPSEPVFIAAPDAVDEDDGIVLSAVVGVLGKPSFLLILDGKTFKEIARAEVPVKLGLTFHGTFFH